jgi:uncharacterized protein YlxP (DUF503 family)
MIIGLLQFHLLIHDAQSLKDKRRVVSSLKDRLHREHMVSVAEVGDADLLNHALIAVTLVARDGQRVGEVLDHICDKLRTLHDAEVASISRKLIHAQQVEVDDEFDPDPDGSLAKEMLDRATASIGDQHGTTRPHSETHNA